MFNWLAKEKVSMKRLWTAVAAFVAVLVVNGLAGSTTLLGGVQTGEVSDIYANLFAPAGLTFSIWGVIYLLLIVFLLRAFMVIGPKKPIVKVDAMNSTLGLFAISSVLNVAWLFAWQYQVLWLSVIIMLGLLVTLIRIVKLLHAQKMSRWEYLSVRVPFSVYLGWISVATIANVTTWLVSLGWDGFGISEVTWTVVMLAVGALLAVVFGHIKRDPFYVAVFVWAFFGILYKHMSASGFDGAHPEVIVALAVLLPVLVSVAIQLVHDSDHLISKTRS